MSQEQKLEAVFEELRRMIEGDAYNDFDTVLAVLRRMVAEMEVQRLKGEAMIDKK